MSLWESYDETDDELGGNYNQDDWDYDNFEPGIDDDRDDELEEALANCAAMPDGQCGKAGSEECDFECPFREDAHRRLKRAAKREESKP